MLIGLKRGKRKCKLARKFDAAFRIRADCTKVGQRERLPRIIGAILSH